MRERESYSNVALLATLSEREGSARSPHGPTMRPRFRKFSLQVDFAFSFNLHLQHTRLIWTDTMPLCHLVWSNNILIARKDNNKIQKGEREVYLEFKQIVRTTLLVLRRWFA